MTTIDRATRDQLRANAEAPMERVYRLNGMGGGPEYGNDERSFPDEILALLDALDQAEARIKAMQDLLDEADRHQNAFIQTGHLRDALDAAAIAESGDDR